jgi:hypothetical protein
VITIRNPIVVLEKCDKIWETLQLIKTIQDNESESDEFNEEEEEEEEDDDDDDEDEDDEDDEDDDEEIKKEKKEEEEKQVQQSIKPSSSSKPTLEYNNPMPLPFEFSVKRMKKLFPCSTCGKQYMEKRSLRKHSERVHGIIIPLLRRRIPKKSLEKKEINPTVLPDKKDSSERFSNNTSPQENITANFTNIEVPIKEYSVSRYVKCELCKRKVKSLREHLINYHKIGGSSNIVKLESSLLNEEKPSSSKSFLGTRRTMLKDILSGKPPQKHIDENTQDESCITNNEGDTDTNLINMKRKYTLPYIKENKRFKLQNEGSLSVPKNVIIPRKKSINMISYKCDICLGTYASAHGLYKHRRVHFLRGETKENFHKFQCRYFNSPLTKRKISNPPINNSIRKVNYKINESVQLNDFECKQNRNDSAVEEQITKKKRKIDEKRICLCGKRFRYSHTLFIHQAKCKLSREENETQSESTAKLNNDKDSGINITIKKRNDSYEIVKDEEKSQKSEDDSSSLNVSEYPAKNTINTVNKQQESDISKYSKDHSILKLQIADEDELIDIENDVLTDPNKNPNKNKRKLVTQEDNKDVKSSSMRKNNNEKDMEMTPDKVSTLKQICQKVLNSLQAHTSTNVVKDQETPQEDNQIKNQEIKQENIQAKDTNYRNKRELRSSNKRTRNINEEYEYSYETYIRKLELLLTCGYCNEQFSDDDAYNNHQCTITEGKSFDEYSLHLICFYCNKTLTDYNEFDQHIRFEHFDRAFNCYQCTERFLTDKARLRHFHMEHSDLHCKFCTKKLTVSSKALHEGYHLGFGYPCHICKKAYINKKNLSYHKYTIHPRGANNIITCTLCLKPIKCKSFRGHMSSHKHNVCYFCGKLFSNRTGTEYHTMIHHGTNSKLKCNVCGTRFFTKKQLDKHEKVDGCSNEAIGKSENTATDVKTH